MSDNPRESDTGWSIEALRAYLDMRLTHVDERIAATTKLFEQRFADMDKAVRAAFISQEKAVSAALAAAEKAVGKAEVAAEKRLDSVNEFRGQLADQAGTFIPRSEAELQITTLAKDLDALNTRMDKNEGRSGGFSTGWVILATVAGLVVAVIAIYVGLR